MRTELKLLIITLFIAIIFCLACRIARATTYFENQDISSNQQSNENDVKDNYEPLITEEYEIICINGYSFIRNKKNGNLLQMFEEGFSNAMFNNKRNNFTKTTLPTRCK